MEAMEALRRHGTRDMAPQVVETGRALLKRRGARLGVEQWSVREQVFLAALDMAEVEVCESMLKELEAQFPGSQRVARLRGLLLELQGKSKEASNVYDEMLKANANNTLGTKRKVCLLMSAGKLPEAIKALGQHLEVFQGDAEGWKQLAALHIEAGQLRNASFCLEEVILSEPHNYVSYLAYADSLYTLGGEVSNLVDARKYYCHSLTKKANNTRALWGLAVCTKAVDGFDVKSAGKAATKAAVEELVDAEKNSKLNAKAVAELTKLKLAPGVAELVKAAAERLAVK